MSSNVPRVDGGPLTGIRVLDVSHNLAGPLTGMHLGDLGAEVIKIERPSGDEWRLHEIVPGHPGRSRHHLQTNRNKRAVCIDLTTADGQGIAHELVRRYTVEELGITPLLLHGPCWCDRCTEIVTEKTCPHG